MLLFKFLSSVASYISSDSPINTCLAIVAVLCSVTSCLTSSRAPFIEFCRWILSGSLSVESLVRVFGSIFSLAFLTRTTVLGSFYIR